MKLCLNYLVMQSNINLSLKLHPSHPLTLVETDATRLIDSFNPLETINTYIGSLSPVKHLK